MSRFTVFYCGRHKPEEPRPVCTACQAKPAEITCQFELRGAKVGQLCGKQLCGKCAESAPGGGGMTEFRILVCRPHAALLRRTLPL